MFFLGNGIPIFDNSCGTRGLAVWLFLTPSNAAIHFTGRKVAGPLGIKSLENSTNGERKD